MKKSKISAAAVLVICTATLVTPFLKLYEGAEGSFSLMKITDLAISFSEKADLSYLNLVSCAVLGFTIAGAVFLAVSLLIFAMKKARPNKLFFAAAAFSSFCLFVVNLLPLFIDDLIEASIELYTQREIEAPGLYRITTLLCAAALIISIRNCFRQSGSDEKRAEK